MTCTLPRHIGLYRPVGFKPNKFICFHTRNPDSHFNAIYRAYNKPEILNAFDVLSEVFGFATTPLIFYTKMSYANYVSIHSKIVDKFNGEKNEYSNIKFWPIITIEGDKKYVVGMDLDKFIIENVLDTKE